MGAERREIVVVGAGPAGSAAAREAALAGLDPLLVEQDDTPGARNACGGVAAHAYRRKLRLPDEVVEREIRRAVFRIGGDQTCSRFEASRPTHISFQRSVFDAFLAERAVRAGAELLNSTRVVRADPATMRLGLKDRATGRESEVIARTVIFADGPATLAAGSFGIGHRPGRDTLFGSFVELEGGYADGQTMEFVLDTSARNKGYFWIFPKRDFVQVGVGGALLPGAVPYQEQLARFVEVHPDLRGRTRLNKGAGMIPCDRSAPLVTAGAMVVGDAAGLANPLTGGGIGIALASGEIAGRVAAAAVRSGRTDRAALSRYPRRLVTTPQYLGLVATAWLCRGLGHLAPDAQPGVYAQLLRRFWSLQHAMRSVLDVMLA